MSLVIYECSHFPTVLPTFDMSIPFFVLIYSYKMVRLPYFAFEGA